MRPIDADALVCSDKIWKMPACGEFIGVIPVKDIDKAPTLDVRPNIHGEWLVPYLHCSVCGGQSLTITTFCGHCGARMDGVNEGL